MEWNLSEKVTAFCRDHSLDVKLSSEMPAGYETAFGTYDVTVNTLFFNEKLLERAPNGRFCTTFTMNCATPCSTNTRRSFLPKSRKADFMWCFTMGFASS